MSEAVYDRIGRSYTRHRRPDPRIAAAIERALGDARTVVDVGGGTGSYETAARAYVAVDPSPVMLRQRAPQAGPAVRAVAESLPFPTGAFDAALAVLTVHHWPDVVGGLRELARVAARVVVFTFEPAVNARYWLMAEYLPEAATVTRAMPTVDLVASALGASRVVDVPVPHDCLDGFCWAYWRRPAAYLDPEVRACISCLATLPDGVVEAGIARLRADLDSGAWHERHADLTRRTEVDAGMRLVVRDG